ncbi:protein RALF-like 24 [Neltuma alba]|uniref:protein RALF-like 24 n=1 Tax=Neltuma alba TaxID=207710 RepID=UPI0010A41AEC|nr:protein RALF-like 24 [Prosopis alba]
MSQASFILWTCLCLSLAFQYTHLPLCDGLSVVDLNLLEHGEFHVMTKRVCAKSIGECLTDPQMDSETNRRLLAVQKRYLSYETLRRDMVPCDRAGASYYNCRATQANPYNRGCEVITGCARVNDCLQHLCPRDMYVDLLNCLQRPHQLESLCQ